MNTAAKIKGIIVFKDSSDGIIKFRFFFDETTYESPVVTKNTLSDAELFILQTQLSDSLYFNTVRKQLKTAYKYLLMGKKNGEVVYISGDVHATTQNTKKNNSLTKKQKTITTEQSSIPTPKKTEKRERVINVQRSKSGIHITVLNGLGTSTLTFKNIKIAREKFNSSHYEMEQKWYDAIFNDRLSNISEKKKKQTNFEKWKNKKEKSKYSDFPDRLKTGYKKYEELLHISIGKDFSDFLLIKVDDISFRSFSDAINYIETESTESEMFKRLQVKYLKEKKDNHIRDLWIPRLKKILSQNYLELSDLVVQMNKYGKTPMSEKTASYILSLCSDLITEKLIEEKSYYCLKNGEYRRPIVNPSHHTSDAADVCTEFRLEYTNLLKQSISGESEDIYVGFDFGTSYTKCAYHLDENNKGIFMFGDTPFKSTVVYLSKDETLSFFRPEDESKQIQFFKATMINDEKQYSGLRYCNLPISNLLIKENFEMLCSSFFIANIICFMRHKLCKQFHCSPELQIAMGVPLFNNYENQKIYNRALHAGIFIADNVENPSVISLKNLYDFYLKSGETFDNVLYSAYPYRLAHCTIPELFTEALYLLNRTDYMPGYYFVVDIGGGTADFAFIKKEDAQFESVTGKTFQYHCPRAEVVNLGNEVRKACGDDIEAIKEYTYQFGLTYRKTIAQSRFGLDVHDEMIIKQLLFGGGSVDPSRFYQKKIAEFRSGLSAISCKVVTNSEDQFLNSFISQSLDLSSEDKQRLIIATQLAVPSTSDAYLQSRPDNYDPTPKTRDRIICIEDHNPGYDSIG